MAAYCHQVLGEIVRPRRRSNRKKPNPANGNGHSAPTPGPRGPENGALSKPKEVTLLSKGGTPPRFEPVRRGLYIREYELMLAHAKAELKPAKADPTLRERVLRPDVAELCAWLRKEAQEQVRQAQWKPIRRQQRTRSQRRGLRV